MEKRSKTKGGGSAKTEGSTKRGEGDYQLTCGAIYTTSGEMSWSTPGFHTNGHSCLYLPANEGSIFLFGGYNGSRRTADLYRLDNASHIGTDDPSYPLAWHKEELQTRDRSGHGSFIRNGKLYVHAGYDSKHEVLCDLVEIDLDTYATQTIEYAERLRSNQERRWHCFFLHENKYFAHGGWNDSGPLDDLITLNLDTLQWQQLTSKGGKGGRGASSTPSARRWHTLTPLSEGSSNVFLFGGYNGGKEPLGDAYVLNLDTGSWNPASFKGRCPAGRSRHTVTEIGPKQLLLIGGYSGTDETYKEMFILHTDDMSWTELPEKVTGPLFPVIRSGHSVTRIGDNRLFISGGFVPDYVEPCYYLDTRKLS